MTEAEKFLNRQKSRQAEQKRISSEPIQYPHSPVSRESVSASPPSRDDAAAQDPRESQKSFGRHEPSAFQNSNQEILLPKRKPGKLIWRILGGICIFFAFSGMLNIVSMDMSQGEASAARMSGLVTTELIVCGLLIIFFWLGRKR